MNSTSALYCAIAASARPAGGSAEQKARRLCQTYLEERGFTCREQGFEYSSFPARFVVPLVGVVFFGCAVAVGFVSVAGRALSGGMSLAVVAVWCVTLILAGWLGRRGTVSFPWCRRESVNLEATRSSAHAVPVRDTGMLLDEFSVEPTPEERNQRQPELASRYTNDSHNVAVRWSHQPEPVLWLMAHLDSKSQPIPMVLRVAAVFASLIGWTAIFVLLLVSWATGGSLSAIYPTMVVFATLAVIGAVGLMCCVIGNKSAGALDNASGVATVLASIDHIDPKIPLRIILTSAEEIGLAGAYAYLNEWNRKRIEQNSNLDSSGLDSSNLGSSRIDNAGLGSARSASLKPQSIVSPDPLLSVQAAATAAPTPIIINCDSFDDRGAITCMLPKRDTEFFRQICADASRQTDTTINIRRLIPGILTDSVVFSTAGFRAMTVSRGTWSTLARIHSRRDTISTTSGAEIDHSAICVARIVMNLTERTLFHPSLID